MFFVHVDASIFYVYTITLLTLERLRTLERLPRSSSNRPFVAATLSLFVSRPGQASTGRTGDARLDLRPTISTSPAGRPGRRPVGYLSDRQRNAKRLSD